MELTIQSWTAASSAEASGATTTGKLRRHQRRQHTGRPGAPDGRRSEQDRLPTTTPGAAAASDYARSSGGHPPVTQLAATGSTELGEWRVEQGTTQASRLDSYTEDKGDPDSVDTRERDPGLRRHWRERDPGHRRCQPLGAGCHHIAATRRTRTRVTITPSWRSSGGRRR